MSRLDQPRPEESATEPRAHQKGGMAQRGVTRMAMGHDAAADSDDHAQHEDMGNGVMRNGGMGEEARCAQQAQHHRQTLWVYWTIILLGAWMVAGAFTFGYQNGVVQVAGDRWLPWTLETRQRLMFWSDLISGALLLGFGWLSLNPFRPKALWGACLVGVWMNFAPLLFWSPTAWGYVNNTLVGALVVALTVLIPGMPWMIMMMEHGPQVPKGWSYNPSSWPQRWIMIATGIAGWFVSRYLGAYQLGYISHIWEPFFGEGSARVLNSSVSHLWPISDGGLGAFTYTFEALMGFMGSPARWRTMPWMVLLFGVLVIPLGLTHVLLIMSQPVLVGHWCTFCLLAAAIMLPMIPLEIDEVVAMCQFMVQSKRDGKPFWRTFWRGGTAPGEGADQRSPALTDAPRRVLPAMFWGMSLPWTLGLTTLLGIWLMVTPALLGDTARMADSDHLIGALVITISVISMAEVVRAGRYFNGLLGLWIVASPFVVSGASSGGVVNAVIVGLLITALTIPRGVVREEYGLWNKYVV
ncbi:MAG: vitamin K epoxide reductase family protein [Caldilineaceae bacterium]